MIIQRYRPGASEHSLQNGDDVRFEEFVQFLLDSRVKRVLDIHWRPYYQICHPCLMQYDFIGKYETLDEDVNFVLQELGVKHLINFPERPNTPKTGNVFKSIISNISSEQIHNLWKLYSVDYSMFDYSYPDFTDS
jgi:chondroitin 4-sulfotransferase 11